MADVRDKAQERVVDFYFDRKIHRGTGVLCTGYGKSKVVIDILKRKELPPKVLILVNSEQLRDDSWKEEFEKFGLKDYYHNNVEMNTYQTAYKWTPDTKDLEGVEVICDEVDFAGGTDKLANFFYAYPNNSILGVTGFITDNKREWFSQHLPIFVEYTTADAQREGILNQTHYVFVKYDLSKDRSDYEVAYMKHGTRTYFNQSENDSYDYADRKFRMLLGDAKKFEKEFEDGEITFQELEAKLKINDYDIKRAVNKRNDFLLNSIAGSKMAIFIRDHMLQQSEDNKVITFSMRTDQADKIGGKDHVYHGKIPKKQGLATFKAFQQGLLRHLSVCGKINRGANIKNLRIAIFESFFGSDTDATQKGGRMLRLNVGDTAIMFVLLPYFMRREKDKTYTCQPTQQVEWARSMLRSTDVESSSVWDYRAVKNDK